MKRSQNFFIFIIVIVIAIAGASLFFMFAATEPEGPSGNTIEELFEGEGGNPIIVMLVIFFIITAGILPFVRLIFPTRIKNGEKAKATVLKVWDTGTTINDNPQVGLTLQFATKEGARIETEAKRVVSRLQVSLIQPGVSANILYDPAKPKRVQVLDFEVSEGQADTPEERLEQLTRLRDKRLISEAEFQTKRDEIIKSI